MDKLEELRQQLMDVHARRQARESEIASIENQALKVSLFRLDDILKCFFFFTNL